MMARSGGNWSVRSPHYPPVILEFGRYEVLGRLAVGGMAEIFVAQAFDRPDERVVIKRLVPDLAEDDELVTMFLDEARLGMRLHHPNLCRFYDVGTIEGSKCIAMEYIEGVTLEDLSRRAFVDGGIPVGVAVRIVANVAAALHHVHRARDEKGQPLHIVHRDVTPRNVMVGYDGSVKLLDFGLARSKANHAITQPGVAKGKFGYLSPEQYAGLPFDARADVFALGVCLFELVTTSRLYRAATPLETMEKIVHAPIPSIRSRRPELSADLDAMVGRALAKSPDDRFHSASEMHTALEGWLLASSPDVGRTAIVDLVGELFHQEKADGPTLRPTSFGSSIPPRGRKDSLPALPPPPRLPGVDEDAVILPSAPPVVTESVLPSARRRRWPAIAAALAAGSALLVALVLVGTAGSEAAAGAGTVEATEGAPASGEERAEDPAGASPVAADPVTPPTPEPNMPAEPAPVEVDPGTPGAAEPAMPAEPAPAEATPSAGASAGRPAATAPDQAALLSINTRPWSEVSVNGRSVGMTPIGALEVPAGPVRLTFVDGLGRRHAQRLELEPDTHETLFVDLDEAASD